MSNDVGAAKVEAAKEITLTMLKLLTVPVADASDPKKLGQKGATLYAAVLDGIYNPEKYRE